jgi:menaquinone-specific isochorismate synthase
LAKAPHLLDEAGDTGLLWRDEHGGLAGRGVARRIALPGGLADPASVQQVADALQGIETLDEVGVAGTGPVAIGALPFDPLAPGQLVIPERVVGRSGDKYWMTTVEEVGAEKGSDEHQVIPHPGLPPDEFHLASSMSHADWCETVAGAVGIIERGDLRKVVLARRVDITGNRPFVVSDVLERLVALYPSCMIFSVEGFLGASPELLIRRTGTAIETHPLAGTVARSGDAHGDEALVATLMASPKARHEHQVVIDALVQALGPLCSHMTVPERPSIMGLRNVSHLATHITGTLLGSESASRAEPPTALDLVALIHPTPAVGGTPTDSAIRYLQKAEGFDRRFYCGPVGWVDARGDGAWAIGIRCAEVEGAHARIYAGNGIVAGSDPQEELAETQLKLQALLAALVRP